MKPMKQQCYLWSVWFTWIGLPALAIGMGVVQGWWAALVVLLLGGGAQIFYIKIFPRVSPWLGYGSVEDVAVESALHTKAVPRVILYTASVCPFCPIVRQRLIELQRNLRFEFMEVDITFQPALIREKRFRSVPVIEQNGRYWIGNATSSQLAAFLTKAN